MSKDYFTRCQDCGYLWPGDDGLTNSIPPSASFKCRHCGSQNSRIIPQQEGRFGCVGNPPHP